MSRRQRQLVELQTLCHAGAVRRAVDLAFEHFAAFGRDDQIVGLLDATIEQARAPADVRRRFAELAAASSVTGEQ